MLGVAAAALVLGAPAIAPAQVDLPSAVEPGQIDDRFQPGVVPRAEPRDDADIDVEPQQVPPGAEQVRFVLNSVQFDGATTFEQTAFEPLYQDRIGQEVSLADIFDVARQATIFYRNQGFILSLVVVPAQDIQDGNVRLQVVEGFIDEVVIEGEIEGDPARVQGIADQILVAQPVRAEDLERYLLLVGDLPGVSARGVLSPSPTTQGASRLTIVLEHDFIDAFATVDNRGSKFIGPVQITTGASFNSVLGFNERLSFLFATSGEVEELAFGQFEGAVPVGNEGTTVGLRFSFSTSEPGNNTDLNILLDDLDVKSDGFRGTLFASHPVIRSREQNLFVGLSFDFIENDIEQSLIPGTPIIQTADDSLRVLRANASYDFVDDFLGVPFIGVNLVTVEVSQGLDIWDASREGDVPLTRANGDGEFTTVNVSATRVQQIAQNWSVRLAFAGQYASEALLSAEEFGVGGAQFGRGYDPSEITGDHGVAASAELQYGRVLDRPWLDSYQAYLFYDYGRVYDIGEDTDDQYLDSTGGGVRLNISDQFSAQLEIARQLSLVSQSNEEDDRETRFLFSITGRI